MFKEKKLCQSRNCDVWIQLRRAFGNGVKQFGNMDRVRCWDSNGIFCVIGGVLWDLKDMVLINITSNELPTFDASPHE